jgi:hypothetical protein
MPHPKLNPLKITYYSRSWKVDPSFYNTIINLTHVTTHPQQVDNSDLLIQQGYTMVSLDVNRTSEALAVAGGYVVVIGLVSYFVKEKLFMCEFIAMIGVIVALTLQSRGSTRHLGGYRFWSARSRHL